MKQHKKLCTKKNMVMDTGRNKTLNEVNSVENINKNSQSF